MGKDAFKYIGMCMLAYLSIFLIEVFILKPLIDFLGNGFWNNFIVYTILCLIINPIITWFIMSKFKFESPDIIVEEDGK